ncbi:E3 ubiquitin-protein ligase RNF167-like isoform X1, partial [Leptotrombidium deliense]
MSLCVYKRGRSLDERINDLPSVSYQKGSTVEECSICYDEYVEKDRLRVLACNHKFHSKCVDVWLRNNNRECPLCRSHVPLESSTDSNDDY